MLEAVAVFLASLDLFAIRFILTTSRGKKQNNTDYHTTQKSATTIIFVKF